jgi:hypothetical protein
VIPLWATTLAVRPEPPLVTVEGAVITGATGTSTTVAVVLADLAGSAAEVAVMVTVPGDAGAIQTPVVALMVPPVELQLSAGLPAPVTVAVKDVEVPTVTAGLEGVTPVTETVWTVTVIDAETLAPTAFVTVSV